MDVHFVIPDLRRLDALQCEALAIGFFEDERPARGALGLLDWRMCGAVSRLLTGGRLTGEPGERMLLPTYKRFPFEKLFLFGLGSRADFDAKVFVEVTRDMLATLTRAGVRSAAVGLPGRANDLIEPREAMEKFLDVAEVDGDQDEVTLVESLEAQKTMTVIMEQAKRRARADVT